jgi:hypothetical protein
MLHPVRRLYGSGLRARMAQGDPLLKHDTALLLANLEAHNWIGLVPVDQHGPEVDIEIGQADAVRVDFAGESNLRRREIAAGYYVQAARMTSMSSVSA